MSKSKEASAGSGEAATPTTRISWKDEISDSYDLHSEGLAQLKDAIEQVKIRGEAATGPTPTLKQFMDEFQPPPSDASWESLVGSLRYWVARAKLAEARASSGATAPQPDTSTRGSDKDREKHQLQTLADWKAVSTENEL